MSPFHFLLKAIPKIDYLGIILDLKWPFLLCFTFIIFSLPWHPLQFRQAGEKCLMFIQRPKTLGENHPPLPPWLTTARQRGANRPAAAAGGEIRPPSRPWRLDERARPLPPRPCANQVSPASCRPCFGRLKWVRVFSLEGHLKLNCKNYFLGHLPRFIYTWRLTLNQDRTEVFAMPDTRAQRSSNKSPAFLFKK